MQVLSVSRAVGHLKELVENDLLFADLWISGEVSDPRRNASGHAYFRLKDSSAQLNAVMFSSHLRRQRRPAEYLTHGSQVMAHGRLSVYESRGSIEMLVDFVQPEGVGLQNAQFERLRQQLAEEGLFDAARKRSLPAFPRRIGVVTSASGAVFHDICHVLRRRWPLAEVVLAPTPVQGPDAVDGIVSGIEALNLLADIDVVIVARGGGSREELWAFSEEQVARAVFASRAPVVSGVGHETDESICDYVADLRAPTPSAAAELVAPDRAQILVRLRAMAQSALASAGRKVERQRANVEASTGRASRGLTDLRGKRERLQDLRLRALLAVEAAERDRHAHLRRCQAQLQALDPQATLDRGYAVVHRDGLVVSSVSAVGAGDGLIIKVADGGFPAKVSAPGSRRPRSSGGARRNGAAKPRGVQPVLFP